jgi:hypothetical protein
MKITVSIKDETDDNKTLLKLAILFCAANLLEYRTHPNEVLDERKLEYVVEFDLFVLQDVLNDSNKLELVASKGACGIFCRGQRLAGQVDLCLHPLPMGYGLKPRSALFQKRYTNTILGFSGACILK